MGLVLVVRKKHTDSCRILHTFTNKCTHKAKDLVLYPVSKLKEHEYPNHT